MTMTAVASRDNGDYGIVGACKLEAYYGEEKTHTPNSMLEYTVTTNFGRWDKLEILSTRQLLRLFALVF